MNTYLFYTIFILHTICILTNYWIVAKFTTSYPFNIGYWTECDKNSCYSLSVNDPQTKYIKNARLLCLFNILLLLFIFILFQYNIHINIILTLLFIYISLNIFIIIYWLTTITSKLKQSGTIYNKIGFSLILYIILTVFSIFLFIQFIRSISITIN